MKILILTAMLMCFCSTSFACFQEDLIYSCGEKVQWVENSLVPKKVEDEWHKNNCGEIIFGRHGRVTARKMNDFCKNEWAWLPSKFTHLK
jgi:hypothetical protein